MINSFNIIGIQKQAALLFFEVFIKSRYINTHGKITKYKHNHGIKRNIGLYATIIYK